MAVLCCVQVLVIYVCYVRKTCRLKEVISLGREGQSLHACIMVIMLAVVAYSGYMYFLSLETLPRAAASLHSILILTAREF